jgi:hypothetical protein
LAAEANGVGIVPFLLWKAIALSKEGMPHSIFTVGGSKMFGKIIMRGLLVVALASMATSTEADVLDIGGGTQVTVPNLTVTDSVTVHDAGSLLHVLGYFEQSAGYFSVSGSGAVFQTDGPFYKWNTDGDFDVTGGATFQVGDLSAGTVAAAAVEIDGGSQVTIASLTASSNVNVSGTGSLLHAHRNYLQTNGNFMVSWGGSFQTDGTFTKTGTGDFSVTNGATFQVGDLSAGSIAAAAVNVNGGSQVTIPGLTATNYVHVCDTGSSLHVHGNYVQTGGDFWVSGSGVAFQIDGTFTLNDPDPKYGFTVGDGATFLVGDLSSGTVATGAVIVSGGSQVTIPGLTATNYVHVYGTGSSLHVRGNYFQTGGDFWVSGSGVAFQTDGTFTLNNPDPKYGFTVGDGATFLVGDLSSGTVATGAVVVGGGSQVAIPGLTATNYVHISSAGSSLHVHGNYLQTGGDFFVSDSGAAFQTDGTFTVNTTGAFQVVGGATFSVGDVSGGLVTVGSVNINGVVTLPQLTSNGNVSISPYGISGGSNLHVVGNFSQNSGDFFMGVGPAQFHTDGTFNLNTTGSFQVIDGSTLSVGDLTGGSVTVGSVNIGGTVTLPQLTSNGDVGISGYVSSGGSNVRVAGNFSENGGNFFIGTGPAQLHTDGTFNLNTTGSFQVIDGSSLTVGDLTGGSVTVGSVNMSGTATLPQLTCKGSVSIGYGSSLHVAGNAALSGATVAVSDSGSLVAVAGSLYLGNRTPGSTGPTALGVGSGAAVTVGSVLDLANGSSVDLTGGGIVNVGTGPVPVTAGTIRVGPSGKLAGDGFIYGSLLVDGGTLSPGHSPGTLTIVGDMALLSNGNLLIEIAGSPSSGEYDRLDVQGNAHFGGNLTLEFEGYNPSWNGEYTFLQALSQNGAFDSVNIVGIDPSLVQYDGHSGSFSVVPEPSTFALLGIGAFGLFAYAWRRQRVS